MSGNYISHFMSSGLMVLLFLLAVSWLSYSTSDYSFRQDNYQLEIAYILTPLISLGWMMSMLVGIVLDLFPLTPNLDSYSSHTCSYQARFLLSQSMWLDIQRNYCNIVIWTCVQCHSHDGNNILNSHISTFQQAIKLGCSEIQLFPTGCSNVSWTCNLTFFRFYVVCSRRYKSDYIRIHSSSTTIMGICLNKAIKDD